MVEESLFCLSLRPPKLVWGDPVKKKSYGKKLLVQVSFTPEKRKKPQQVLVVIYPYIVLLQVNTKFVLTNQRKITLGDVILYL